MILNRKNAMATAIALLMTPSVALSSGIPVVDAVANTLQIKDMLETATNWAKEQVMFESSMELESLISTNQQSTNENVAANTIVRVTEAIEKTHEKNIAMEATPSWTACSTVSHARSLRDSKIASSNYVKSSIDQMMLTEKTTNTELQHKELIAKDIVARMNQVNEMATSPDQLDLFSRADNFLRVGSYSAPVYSEVELEAANIFADLLLGPYRSVHTPSKLKPGSRGYEDAIVQEKQRTVRKALAAAIVQDYKADYIPSPSKGTSNMQAMESFIVGERSLNPDWIKVVTCTKETTNPAVDCANSAILLKELIQMTSWKIMMDKEILDHTRYGNMLNATSLAMTVEDSK